MSPVLVQREQGACWQIERPTFRSHEDMAGDGLDRDPTHCLMLRKPRPCLEGGEDDTEVVILDERLGVLPAVPLRLSVKLLQFPGEIEFEKGSGHRRRVRSPVLVVVLWAV